MRPAHALHSRRPVRVLLLLGDLNGGGAERVALTLMDRCDPALLDMRIGVMRRKGTLLDEPDPERLTSLPSWPKHWTEAVMTPVHVARMIGEVNPHVVMSFGMGVDALMWPALRLMSRRRPRWICRQDSNPDAEIIDLGTGPKVRRAVTFYMRGLQRSADGRVAVSAELAKSVDRGRTNGGWSTRVIHNPIDTAQIQRDAARPLPVTPVRPFIVAAGRLVRQKGFDILIQAFAQSQAARGIELVILGDGPLEGALRAQATALGITDRVRLPGYQSNPWAWFARARLLAVPSRWEGYGNVVAEAHACGAPVLVTDCDFGPREQIIHGVTGWIARTEDPASLGAALDTMLSDPDLMARFVDAGRERAKTFEVDAAVRAYTAMFLEAAACSGSSAFDPASSRVSSSSMKAPRESPGGIASRNS